MIVVPIYDMIILPGVTFYFKQDVFQELETEDVKEGEELIFLYQKEDKERQSLTAEDFYPIGVEGKVEGIDRDGNINVRTFHRVDIHNIEVTEGNISLEAVNRDEIEDIDAQECQMRFEKMRTSLLRFAQGFQWGVWARSYILHWKSISEVVSALSSYLNLTNEERYQIVETDVLSQRIEKMEHAVYEFIEVTRVGEEAENAQQERHEKVYREDAIKKQIDFLQRQLDEMHPENVSDVRRFEQKIEESGMNETARKEAEKILNRMKQEGKDSHEYGMLYDYLDFVTTLSWKKEEVEAWMKRKIFWTKNIMA